MTLSMILGAVVVIILLATVIVFAVLILGVRIDRNIGGK